MRTIELSIKEDGSLIIGQLVEKTLVNEGADRKTIKEVKTIADEIWSNIAEYAYLTKDGTVSFSLAIVDEYVELTFIDGGLPFNPLEYVSNPSNKNKGLGIFIVKKLSDSINYNYYNRKNVLKIRKKIIYA